MKTVFVVTEAMVTFVLPLAAQSNPGPLRLVQTIPLRVEGRLDHLSADVRGMRLVVAALGNNSVEVIDLRTGKRIGSLTGLQKPQGVWYAPYLQKLFFATGNDGSCLSCSGKTLELIKSIKLDLGAD